MHSLLFSSFLFSPILSLARLRALSLSLSFRVMNPSTIIVVLFNAVYIKQHIFIHVPPNKNKTKGGDLFDRLADNGAMTERSAALVFSQVIFLYVCTFW